MSKQSDAKKNQGYRVKAVPQTCVNCKNFLCDHINKNASIMGKTGVSEYWSDTNMHCSIGGFAVKKAATCKLFEIKTAQVEAV